MWQILVSTFPHFQNGGVHKTTLPLPSSLYHPMWQILVSTFPHFQKGGQGGFQKNSLCSSFTPHIVDGFLGLIIAVSDETTVNAIMTIMMIMEIIT